MDPFSRSLVCVQIMSIFILPSPSLLSCPSRLGPASYDLGTSKYEENIIVDCFGMERLREYRRKHKLDVW
jgi:hypothetical protein